MPALLPSGRSAIDQKHPSVRRSRSEHRSTARGGIHWLHRGAVAAAVLLSSLTMLASTETFSASALAHELRSFRQLGSVLYIAAHPDDENNSLLPYLARGRGLRTAYLSLTRGDGGQNLIGPELGAELGVIRTHELLAARRIDGAEQFFTRAKDFGFSKDSADTLQRWDRDAVTADIVRVIRTFRPDVVITRFSPVPGGTHGHHTASAILALAAFKLAGDPNAFRDQLGHLPPWQPKRILHNGRGQQSSDTVRLDAGGYEPLFGESFGEIGARARSMHKSQGEGRTGNRGTNYETFQLLDGEPATGDLLDGVESTWARIPGGAEIGALVDDVIAKFAPYDPAASVPALLAIRAKLAALPTDPLVAVKRAQLDRILQGCLALFVETVVVNAQVVPGEKCQLRHNAIVRTSIPVRWVGVRYPNLRSETVGAAIALAANEVSSRENTETILIESPLSQPYWLQEEGTEGMFRVADATLIGRSENPPTFPVEHIFELEGQTLVIADEPVQIINDPVRGELRRPLDVIAPVSVAWVDDLQLFAPGSSRKVSVELTAARAGVEGSLQIESTAGWKITPASHPFRLGDIGQRTQLTFEVTAPSDATNASFLARAAVGERRYHRERTEVRYDHIPVQLLQPSAVLKGLALQLETRGRAIGYIPGAGDAVPEALRRMGYVVTTLATEDLALEKLEKFDAIVIGVRAFNTRNDLDGASGALAAYAEAGGTVVVQYNTDRDLRSSKFAPYDLRFSRDRITIASAPVTLLQPEHPALSTPNKITTADFEGWVQERARYVPRSWTPPFVPLLASNDPGESPLHGTLLVAPHGRGHFVYTGLSFFRQLPAGVPGAYRLFANLVSLGKQ